MAKGQRSEAISIRYLPDLTAMEAALRRYEARVAALNAAVARGAVVPLPHVPGQSRVGTPTPTRGSVISPVMDPLTTQPGGRVPAVIAQTGVQPAASPAAAAGGAAAVGTAARASGAAGTVGAAERAGIRPGIEPGRSGFVVPAPRAKLTRVDNRWVMRRDRIHVATADPAPTTITAEQYRKLMPKSVQAPVLMTSEQYRAHRRANALQGRTVHIPGPVPRAVGRAFPGAGDLPFDPRSVHGVAPPPPRTIRSRALALFDPRRFTDGVSNAAKSINYAAAKSARAKAFRYARAFGAKLPSVGGAGIIGTTFLLGRRLHNQMERADAEGRGASFGELVGLALPDISAISAGVAGFMAPGVAALGRGAQGALLESGLGGILASPFMSGGLRNREGNRRAMNRVWPDFIRFFQGQDSVNEEFNQFLSKSRKAKNTDVATMTARAMEQGFSGSGWEIEASLQRMFTPQYEQKARQEWDKRFEGDNG